MDKVIKVVMIPTRNVNKVWKNNSTGKLSYVEGMKPNIAMKNTWTPQHIYFLSNESMEEGNWCLLFDDFGNILSSIPQQYLPNEGHVLNSGLKKIEFTTDESLGLPKPTDDFLKEYCEVGGIDEVLVEYVEKYDWSLGDIAIDYPIGFKLKVNANKTVNIKPTEKNI